MRADGPILVVDDNEVDLRLTQICYRRAALERPLVALRSGAALVEYLKRSLAGEEAPVSVVLLDVNMPAMSGFQVLEQMQGCASKELPAVVMLSNSDNPADVARSKALGAVDYVVKPTEALAYIDFLKGLASRF